MDTALHLFIVMGALGAFDTLYYHEWRARLTTRPGARAELRLHGARDLVYAALFASLANVRWEGALAYLLGALLLTEVAITLADFIEEDRTRPLLPGERAMHAVMGIVYGAFLAFLAPEVVAWAARPTGLARVDHGLVGWVLDAMALGVFLSGLRDLAASASPATAPRA